MSGLAVFLPAAISRRINAWREQYDPYLSAWDPHITLVYPPFIPLEDWPNQRLRIAEAFQEFPPFTVRLDGVGTFPGDPHVLWLRPDGGGVLERIHAMLEAKFPEYVPPQPFEFIPHVTIGLFYQEDDLREAQQKVMAELEPISFEAREVVYLAEKEDGEHVKDPVLLGSPAHPSPDDGRG